ncbi:ABC transporter substrate-binding protein [Marinomonas sp. 15G1-11]|uniref:ABC transporter substrate-binding protein n=1 Tax=Marinomonas phaeophyticola TaxID=3004091 RepID=A0ABT4JWK3_9GAMM|nr:ABC transporter substrate-binding protein [Marinomonas sp. 15G1-11]MCZ2722683.1 ABC transporter substrate-binding protein [Marinomonas sp. 15G1-11]
MNKTLLATALITASLGAMQVQAADVPAGVKLADKQELVRGGGAEPATLDPQKVEGTPGSHRTRELFEGLYNLNGNGDLIPGVAESYTVNADNTVYTFKLRNNAKWSNGDPVTAHDFVYSFTRAVDPATASPYAWFIEIPSIVNASSIIAGKTAPSELGVKALDDYTFEVTLERPVPYFVKMTAHQTMFPAPKKVIEKFGSDWIKPDNIVSNGAYKMDEWVVNEKMVFSRNDHYWNNDKTVIDKVTFLPIESPTVELTRFQAGEMDVSYELPNDHFKQLKRDIPDEVIITPQLGTYYYQFNTTKAPYDDPRVRKALSYAIDRDIITKFVTGTGELPAYTFTPEVVNGFDPATPEFATWTQKERNEKARALLEDAGFTKDSPLEFNLLYNTNENHKKIAIAVASMWKKTLGVKVTLENQEWKTYLETKKAQNFDVARAGWIGDYNEASTMLDLLTSTHGNNDGKYSNTEYDKLLSEAKTMQNPSVNYNKAEEIAINQDMAVAPIYQYTIKRLVKSYVGGYQPNPEDSIYTRDMYIIAH